MLRTDLLHIGDVVSPLLYCISFQKPVSTLGCLLLSLRVVSPLSLDHRAAQSPPLRPHAAFNKILCGRAQVL